MFLHPNISKTGKICEKTLVDVSKPISFRERINGFINLLSYPNIDDPYNNEAYELYKKSPYDYNRAALKRFRGI